MTGKEAFAVVVRATGLWVALYGVYVLFVTMATQIVVNAGSITPGVFWTYDIVIIVVGIILLRWPGTVVRFAYPREKETLFDPDKIVDWVRAKDSRDSTSPGPERR